MADINIGLNAQQFITGMEKVRQALLQAAKATEALQKGLGQSQKSLTKAERDTKKAGKKINDAVKKAADTKRKILKDFGDKELADRIRVNAEVVKLQEQQLAAELANLKTATNQQVAEAARRNRAKERENRQYLAKLREQAAEEARILQGKILAGNLGFTGGGPARPRGPTATGRIPAPDPFVGTGASASLEDKKLALLKSFGDREIAERVRVNVKVQEIEARFAALEVKNVETTTDRLIREYAQRNRKKERVLREDLETIREIRRQEQLELDELTRLGRLGFDRISRGSGRASGPRSSDPFFGSGAGGGPPRDPFIFGGSSGPPGGGGGRPSAGRVDPILGARLVGERRLSAERIKQNQLIREQLSLSQRGLGFATQRLKTSKNIVSSIKEQVADLGRLVGISLTIGAAFELQQALRDSIALATEFSVAIAEIQTIQGSVGRSTELWASELQTLSNEFGIPILDQAEAAYQAISNQVIKTSGDFGILRVANQLALAAVTDTSTATNILTAALNSFRLQTSEASNVSAQLFETVRLGRLRLEEISEIFGRVGVGANQLGISLAETNAAIATLTIQGLKANEAITLINNIIQKLIRPGESLKTVLGELGFETSEAAVATLGFGGLLGALQDRVGSSSSELGELFQRIRAIRGALGFTGEGLKIFQDNLDSINTASIEDFEQKATDVLQSAGQQLRVEGEKIRNFFVAEFGQSFIVGLSDVSKAVGGFDNVLRQSLEPVKIVAEGIGSVAVAFTELVAQSNILAPIISKTIQLLIGTATLRGLQLLIKFVGVGLVQAFVAAGTSLTTFNVAALRANTTYLPILTTRITALSANATALTARFGLLRGTMLALQGSIIPITALLVGVGLAADIISTKIGEVKFAFDDANVAGRRAAEALAENIEDASEKIKRALDENVDETFKKIRKGIAALRGEASVNLNAVISDSERGVDDLKSAGELLVATLETDIDSLRDTAREANNAVRSAERGISRLSRTLDRINLEGIQSLGVPDAGLFALQQRISDLGFALDSAFDAGNVEEFVRLAQSSLSTLSAQTKAQNDENQRQLALEFRAIEAKARLEEAIRNKDREGQRAIRRELERINFLQDTGSALTDDQRSLAEQRLKAEENLQNLIRKSGPATPRSQRTTREQLNAARARVRVLKEQEEAQARFEQKRTNALSAESLATEKLRRRTEELLEKTKEDATTAEAALKSSETRLKEIRRLLSEASNIDFEKVFAAETVEGLTEEIAKQLQLLREIESVGGGSGLATAAEKVADFFREGFAERGQIEVQKQEAALIDSISEQTEATRELIAAIREGTERDPGGVLGRVTTLANTLETARDFLSTPINLPGAVGDTERLSRQAVLNRERQALLERVGPFLNNFINTIDRIGRLGGETDLRDRQVLAREAKVFFDTLTKEAATTNSPILQRLATSLEGVFQDNFDLGGVGQQSLVSQLSALASVESRLGDLLERLADKGISLPDDEPVKVVFETTTQKKFDDLTAALIELSDKIDKVRVIERPETRALGGFVGGPAGGDRIPALLSSGEFVVNRMAAQRFSSLLTGMNNGTVQPTRGSFTSQTDVGGITVNVNESTSPQVTAKAVVNEINRGLRQGTIQLKPNRR